ncbi:MULTISPECIES: hypothetical protein [unclassified Luteococcus]|uniref:hypothetical protein n=1 Tax=unclassified Luteococcus TaxID=2639923 RepID=UPI00313CD2C0
MRRIALIPLLVLTACSVPDASGPATDSQPVTSGASPTPSEASGPSARATPTTDAPVATREVTAQGFRLALDVYPVRREGRTAVLNTRLRVLERPADEFANADTVLSGQGFADSIHGRANGFSLVDGPRRVVLHPATADGSELCQPDFHGGWERGDVYWTSCLFGAPDPAATELTVRAATFGSFNRVPVR